MRLKYAPLFLGLCSFVFFVFASLVQSTIFEVFFNPTGSGNVTTLIMLQAANKQNNFRNGRTTFGTGVTGCSVAANGRINSFPIGQRSVYLETVSAGSVPEPASYGLLGLALVIAFVISKKRKRETPAVRTEQDLGPISSLAGSSSSSTPPDRE